MRRSERLWPPSPGMQALSLTDVTSKEQALVSTQIVVKSSLTFSQKSKGARSLLKERHRSLKDLEMKHLPLLKQASLPMMLLE